MRLAYVFQGEGADRAPAGVRLSQLFEPGKDSLMIYGFMFPRDPGDQTPGPRDGETALPPFAERPSPSCVAFLDQLDGAAERPGQRVNLAVIAKAPLPRVLKFARERGWRRLRLHDKPDLCNAIILEFLTTHPTPTIAPVRRVRTT